MGADLTLLPPPGEIVLTALTRRELLWVELCFFFSNSITVGDLSLAEGSTVQDWRRQELALTRRDWILSHSLRVCHSLSISGLLTIIYHNVIICQLSSEWKLLTFCVLSWRLL